MQMSPEIIDSVKYNSKTDVWSLGCILFELIYLRVPFAGECKGGGEGVSKREGRRSEGGNG